MSESLDRDSGTVGAPSRAPSAASEPAPAEGRGVDPEGAMAQTSPTRLPMAARPAGETVTDPFPRDAWTTLTGHAAGYLRLTVALVRDPAVSKHRRAALLAAAAYFASPIDLIPGIVPVLGQVDDLAVAMLAIRLALNALEPGRRQMHLAAAGLTDEALHDDLMAAGRLAAWTARAGVRTGLRAGRGAIRFTVRGGRAATALAMRSGQAAGRRAAPAGDRANAVRHDLSARIRLRLDGRRAPVDDLESGSITAEAQIEGEGMEPAADGSVDHPAGGAGRPA